MLTYIPKYIIVGEKGGLYYINAKGNKVWLKRHQRNKYREGSLIGAYDISQLPINNQHYLCSTDDYNTEKDKKNIIDTYVPLNPVPKDIMVGKRGGKFYYNKNGKRIYLKKNQKQKCINDTLTGGYGICQNLCINNDDI